MGINGLYTFLKEQNIIRKVSLSQFQGKTFVFDASIYLYKFKQKNDDILYGLNGLLNILSNHLITPIFVFDGKPDEDKVNVIKERRILRYKASEKVHELKEMLNNDDMDKNEKDELLEKVELFEKRATRINQDDISKCKALLRKRFISYYQCKNEADILCAILCNKYNDYYCLSDDNDMFAYCNNVILKNFDFNLCKVEMVYIPDMLSKIGLSKNKFKRLCCYCSRDHDVLYENDLKPKKFTFAYSDFKNKILDLNKMSPVYEKILVSLNLPPLKMNMSELYINEDSYVVKDSPNNKKKHRKSYTHNKYKLYDRPRSPDSSSSKNWRDRKDKKYFNWKQHI